MSAFRGPQAWRSRWRRKPLARWRRNPLWRWRRNQLRRRSDVLEAWVLLSAWTVTVLCGVLTGLAAAHSVEQGLARERAEWRPVRALVAEDAPESSAAASSGADRVWAKVRWTTANGSTHSGQARVAAGSATGTPVTVWTDRDGLLVTKPVPPPRRRCAASRSAFSWGSARRPGRSWAGGWSGDVWSGGGWSGGTRTGHGSGRCGGVRRAESGSGVFARVGCPSWISWS
ncbi:hypothetical protein SAV31267_081810 [Streptomyces avermitilis]|uniref:Uncharacterized protein n=1 Tax=Streptomyces avermitilis TaxID=33903 RepID=A0A4D4N431_STRAX|nr:hypothetical protein SAV31267_081810 [Streptomyces avermitilis]